MAEFPRRSRARFCGVHVVSFCGWLVVRGGVGRGQLVLEVEYFGELEEALVGRPGEVVEEAGHLGLPAGVDVRGCHPGLGFLRLSVSK